MWTKRQHETHTWTHLKGNWTYIFSCLISILLTAAVVFLSQQVNIKESDKVL